MQVPAPFEYERATSVEHALSLLRQLGPEARIIAGGHSLLPMMKMRMAAPEHLVDINDLDELSYISEEDGEVRIGAMTRHRELLESELLQRRFPIIADAERIIADPVVRNWGTAGGALCQADPSEDLSAVATALDAAVVIRGADGERTEGMASFYHGPFETSVGDGEMLVAIRLPLRPNGASAYEKVERRTGDWAITAAGAAVWLEGSTLSEVGIGLSGVGMLGQSAQRAEQALRGQAPSEELFAQAGDMAAEDCSPPDDQRGPADYKRHLARELTIRALRRAVERALRQEG
ncbi:xanthine dehydrogenase family protein subunit M [soil metagenome]